MAPLTAKLDNPSFTSGVLPVYKMQKWHMANRLATWSRWRHVTMEGQGRGWHISMQISWKPLEMGQ